MYAASLLLVQAVAHWHWISTNSGCAPIWGLILKTIKEGRVAAESAAQEHDAVDEFAEVEQYWHTGNPAYQYIGLLAYWYAGRKVYDNPRMCSHPGHDCVNCWSCLPGNIPGRKRGAGVSVHLPIVPFFWFYGNPQSWHT